MLLIKKLPDGSLIVPSGAKVGDTYVDGWRLVKPQDADYQQWLQAYKEERALMRKIKMRQRKNEGG